MKKIKQCPICHCEAKLVETCLGFGVECERNGHFHNIGLFESKDEAVIAWNFWVGNVEEGYAT